MGTVDGSTKPWFDLVGDERLLENGLLNQQAINNYEEAGLWVPRGNPEWSTCADERPMADPSTDAFRLLWPDVRPPAEGGMANFGQTPGLAKNALAVGVAFHPAGESFYRLVGGFSGMTAQIIEGMQQDAGPYPVRPALHTDEAKEAAAVERNPDCCNAEEVPLFHNSGHAAVGCAYCDNLGKIAHDLGSGPFFDRVAYRDTRYIFGEGNDTVVTKLTAAHRFVARQLQADYSFGRQEYIASGLPVITRQGIPHEPPHTSGVMFNLDPHSTSVAGKGAYRIDAAAAALAIRRALRPYDLPAAAFMMSTALDAIPTRSLLVQASSGGVNNHPMSLAIGKRGGTLQSALAEIAKLEAA